MRRPGMTLLELLVMLAVVGMLVALLYGGLSQSYHVGHLAQCTENLRKIGQAYTVRLSDEGDGTVPALRPQAWTKDLAPYLEDRSEIYRCPEDPRGPRDGGPVPLLKVEVWTSVPWAGFPPNCYVWSMDCEEGPWAARKNETGDSYELWFEDHWNNTWNDLVLRFTAVADGRTRIDYLANHTGKNWYWLVDVNSPVTPPAATGAILITPQMGWPHGTDNEPPGGTPVYVEACGPAYSYGMNSVARGSPPLGADNIVCLDYQVLVAHGPTADVPDDWQDPEWWVPEEWRPAFARHFGRINVLFGDGSVGLRDPDEIDPNGGTRVRAAWVRGGR